MTLALIVDSLSGGGSEIEMRCSILANVDLVSELVKFVLTISMDNPKLPQERILYYRPHCHTAMKQTHVAVLQNFFVGLKWFGKQRAI